MDQATVFVDDAVLGRLPQICVKDGVYTADQLILKTLVGNRNGLGIAWLLVLAGPLGWLGLVILAVSRHPTDTLTVRLPFSESAHRRLRSARRECWIASLAAVVFFVLALITLVHSGRLLGGAVGVVCVVALVRWITNLRRLRAASVAVELDASRRWVTLSGVHPTFAYYAFQHRDFSYRT